jgi:hypothetical protein
MYNISNYHAALDAAKDAQALQICRFVHGFTTGVAARLHRQRDGGAGHAALLASEPAAVPSSSSKLIASQPPPSAAVEQRISGCFRESSPSFS